MRRSILYLYAELANYQYSTFIELVKNSYRIDVVFWDTCKETPYEMPDILDVNFFPKSRITISEIICMANDNHYDIVYMSGWIDKDYIKICKYLKNIGLKVIVGSDTPWYGSFRQYVACIIANFYHKKFCSYMWVAGVRQFEYARRLGFRNDQIIMDCLSANSTVYSNLYKYRTTLTSYDRTFFYVGRNAEVKNVNLLLDAYKIYSNRNEKPWKLQLIGGDFNINAYHEFDIDVIPFVDSEELIELVKNNGCFVLPSIKEPWGVVVHEFAISGYPILISKNVGSRSSFVINGYNGFDFDPKDVNSLVMQMNRITNLDSVELNVMAKRSHELGNKISTVSSVANLLSVI
ncbi:glycosyltransferase [Halosquirtibacter laminarini]|uniref:Glycosyltransferase n=1 Tax=Halosquirtibacter laminarini TaxID=3374600 RepID=A0AC61NGR0_9BACT|nr:glycosyltransferase [Prolixibacteraceae bacterium]